MNPVALICTAVLGLLLFGLGMLVSMRRFQENRLTGFSDDPANALHKAARAHGNTAEYAPFFAVLFLYLGAHHPGPLVVGLIVAATVCRVMIVVGLLAWPTMAKPNPLRFLGALGTYLTGLALCTAVLATL